MKQVTQTFKTGLIEVDEVPIPSLEDKFILVQNNFSVISAGTEKTKIDIGKKNLIQKAKARPDLVRQVIKKLKNDGLKKTFKTVNTRLNAPSPLGYSSSGIVVAVGGMVEGIQPGDRVACAGAGYANHAEYVAVPQNLVAKIPNNVKDESAAFTTIGSIALQGLRLAAPKIGETFLVIGLGLLGQITVQLLKANGCKVIGTDLDNELVSLSESFGAIGVIKQNKLNSICMEHTKNGVDGVIVCAGSQSNQIIETCGKVTREKGRVVVVGAVKMDIPREDYFKKEINIVISRSYGPGRYDQSYEEGGNDYPIGYVRFTEQRNMVTFLDLIAQEKINIDNLITHRFHIEDAPEAYKLIEGEKIEPYLGILLKYDKNLFSTNRFNSIAKAKIKPSLNNKISISFFGAGNYATASLLPHLKSSKKVFLNGILTASGHTASSVSKQFGFSFCSDSFSELLTDSTDAIMIASRHDSHCSAVCEALEARKHVYVEKPLALSIEELSKVHHSYSKATESHLMVGFNRRFAPASLMIKEHFKDVESPIVINIRVNAGQISDEHWIQNPQIGGGRIIGECCHFIDLAANIANSHVSSIFASGTSSNEKSSITNDNANISLKFTNGSVASITYSAHGSVAMPKESIEIMGGGLAAHIYDFQEIVLFHKDGSLSRKKMRFQDKGQQLMLHEFIVALIDGKPCVDYYSLINSSLASILAIESMMTGMPMKTNLDILEN